MDVMFYEVFKEEKALLEKYLPQNILADFTDKTIQECRTQSLPCSLISIRTQSYIPEEWAGKVVGILTRSTGYEHLIEYKKRGGKPAACCGYLPDYCSYAVAEHAILMMFSLWRKLKQQLSQFQRFKRDDITGQECVGKNVLVIGVGRIGQKIVDIAKSLGMNVKGTDPIIKRKDIEYVSAKDGILWADCVVSAVPFTEQTNRMLNYDFFIKAQKKPIFVNISRGEISPLKDLKKLLKEGILAGLALDVFEEEKELAVYFRSHQGEERENIKIVTELKDLDNVIFTPHNAFNTKEALEQKARETIESVSMFLTKKIFPNLIPDI